MPLKGTLPLCCVCLLAKLGENYSTDFHETAMQYRSGQKQFNCSADMDQGADPWFFFTLFNIVRSEFFNIFIDFSENNSWILMKICDMFKGLSVHNLVTIQIKIWI